MPRKPMDPKLGFVPIRRLNGDEAIRAAAGSPVATMLEFWRWSASDVVGNTARGIFAEFLVALALDCAGGVRSGWDAYDLRTKDGVTVEVKSSAYIQAWPMPELSRIQFGIGKRLRWVPETGELVGPKKRQSQVYVFCLLAHQEQATLDPLDLRQWKFFVLATRTLDAKMKDRQQIGLKELEEIRPRQADFRGIAEAVRLEAEAGRD